jgi:hypothetical protein
MSSVGRDGARAKLTHAGNVEDAIDQRQIEGATSPPRHNRAALAHAVGPDDRGEDANPAASQKHKGRPGKLFIEWALSPVRKVP